MQHNNFKKDLAMLTEAYNDIHDQAKVRPEEDIPPQHQDENIGIGEDGEYEESVVGRLEKLVKRLEELSHTFDDTRESHEEWAQIITGIKESLLQL